MFEIISVIWLVLFYVALKSIDKHFDRIDKEEAAIDKKWDEREKESKKKDYRVMTYIQVDNARNFYIHRGLLTAAGISEAEFVNKLHYIGAHAIYDSIKNDTFHRGSDGSSGG